MKKLIAASALSFGMTGCATIINSGKHDLNIVSEPPGATVTVSSNAAGYRQTVTTPATLSLPRSHGYWERNNYQLEFNKDGFETQTARLDAHVSGWYSVGNLFFGGLIGWFAVDPNTGAMYAYDEKTINAKLVPQNGVKLAPASYTPPAAPVAAPQAAQPVVPAKPVAAAPVQAPAPAVAAVVPAPTQQLVAAAHVDTSNLKLGTWSYDVEQMAKAEGCEGEGAWLISKPGLTEAYRVFCKTGKPFTAVCDSTSCKKG
ncbi:hypothetical protein [Chitinimonas sp.]|uniref:hypothetical protein n=1 Tax=Chitinimonas sp. TaxID=1934313 RepID=UPI002F92DC2D